MSYRRADRVSREETKLPHYHGTAITPATVFLKFQTIQEIKNNILPITEEAHDEGCEPLEHQQITMCLQCLGKIDPDTCQSLDNGWSFGWCCGFCGYLKLSKDMTTHFLMGAETRRSIKPKEVSDYFVRSFPWVEDAKEACVNQLYMQIACIAHRGGKSSLKQALGGADFFGYSGIFDALARAWCALRSWQLIAVRLQGVVLLRFDKKRVNYQRGREDTKTKRKTKTPVQNQNADRKVMHFQLANSVLTTAAGKSHSISVLVEHTLDDDDEPIVKKKSESPPRIIEQTDCPTPTAQTLGALGQLICMKLSGVHRKGKGQNKQTLEGLQEVVDTDLEMRSWHFLATVLSYIQMRIPNEGEYCIITIGKPKSAGEGNSFTVQKKGLIDHSCLREDFKQSYRLNSATKVDVD